MITYMWLRTLVTNCHLFRTSRSIKVRIPFFTICIVWVFKLCSLIFISSFVL
ncbi:hypothetical protein HanPSC8_Chr15g0675521 [Helianthus annuus]|nr:hypothetical protein HanPSC8_Chr15g0675521 [Helianthus annuus]